jgi:error-prone DNA polymerase
VCCTVEGDTAFRLGLSGVREVSVATAQAIVAERERAPYRSLFDFLQRTGVPRAAVEHLILAGAFDDFGLERRELLWQLGLFAGLARPQRGRAGAAAAAGAARARQLALPLPVDGDMVPLRPAAAWERLVTDHQALTFSPALHPMGLLRRRLGEGMHTSRHIERLPDGTRVRLAGLAVCRQRPMTAKGVLFLLLEDEWGLTNVVVHGGLYERQRLVIRTEPFVIVDGTLQRRGAVVNVLARTVRPLHPPHDLIAPAPRDFR